VENSINLSKDHGPGSSAFRLRTASHGTDVLASFLEELGITLILRPAAATTGDPDRASEATAVGPKTES
jgi:hypothetical protein